MSFFGVTIEKIEKVWAHPDPEVLNLELASLYGMSYQFIVGKGQSKPGDFVVYFPIDSLMSQAVLDILPEVISKKLAGKGKNRVKTNRLRGAISQGLAMRVEEFPFNKFGMVVSSCAIPGAEAFKVYTILGEDLGKDITKVLGILKYEAPEVGCGGYDLHGLTKIEGVGEVAQYYDIEGCERNPEIIEFLLDKGVVISEKLEGTNLAVVFDPVSDKHHICQRSGEIFPHEGAVNLYFEAATRSGLFDISRNLSKALGGVITIRAEVIGPKYQGNIYKLNKHEARIFEIWQNGKPLPWSKISQIYKDLPFVPILFEGNLRDFLNGRTVDEASTGPSVLNPKQLREGIVIRPVEECEILGFGRVLIKQRSSAYLAKSDN